MVNFGVSLKRPENAQMGYFWSPFDSKIQDLTKKISLAHHTSRITNHTAHMAYEGLWTLSFLPSKWDYWEIGQLNNFFLFVKDIKNVYIFAWESKMFMLFLNVFCDFQYFLKIVSTHFTSHCPKCLFNMNNHKDPAGWVISVERSSR